MRVTRRAAMIGGVAAAGAIGVPVAQKLSWDAKTFTRDGYEPGLHAAPDGRVPWMNWSGNQRAAPVGILSPDDEAALAEAIRAAPGRIRPVGSGHSFTGLVPSDDLIVRLTKLHGLTGYDAATGEATFAAGTTLFQAAEELAGRGRAFENLSDIDVQTLAGAFATGTHGTGERLTPLHDYITAFRIVTASGDVLDVSPDSRADLFQAGKVSLGALGVMTSFTVRTVPAYKLKRRVTVEPLDDVIEQIPDLARTHRNFEFFYLPSTGLAAVIVHDETDEPITAGERDDDDDETLDGLKQLRDELGWSRWLRRRIARANLPRGVIEERVDASHALLSTVRPTQFNEMEYHLPREEGPAMARRAARMLDQRSDVFFPMEYRHVAGDEAWLSPFHGGPRASIAIHAAVDEPYDYFFSDFEPMYLEVGGRPHWGKLHSTDKTRLSALYPRYEEFLDVRRALDPRGKFLNAHLATLFGEALDA